jgi:hypothetical protein
MNRRALLAFGGLSLMVLAACKDEQDNDGVNYRRCHSVRDTDCDVTKRTPKPAATTKKTVPTRKPSTRR